MSSQIGPVKERRREGEGEGKRNGQIGRHGGLPGEDFKNLNGRCTFITAWSVNSSSSVHCISLTAISLCSFVIANASLAWGATDSLAAGTTGGGGGGGGDEYDHSHSVPYCITQF